MTQGDQNLAKSRRGLRYSLMALLVTQILLVLGFWLYFKYYRGSNYPLAVCGVAYAGLILILIAGWWLLPGMLPRPVRSKPLAMLLAGVAGCLAVWFVFPHLRPSLQMVQNPEYPTLEGLAEGSEDAQNRQKAEAKRLGLPVEIVNKVGMRFRFIPAGEFMMGSPEGEKGRGDYEDRHRVVITRPFYIGATEVTQNQWRAITEDNPSRNQGTSVPRGSETDSWPVESISWDDVQVYIRQLCELEWVPADTYRLPTEAEWEYACRAGTETAFYSGECVDPTGLGPFLARIGWAMTSYPYPHPVGQLAANAFGVYDMSGNVQELCLDWYGSYPDDTTDPYAGPNGRLWPVKRGGCMVSWAAYCRSASRAFTNRDERSAICGFRLVRTVEPRP